MVSVKLRTFERFPVNFINLRKLHKLVFQPLSGDIWKRRHSDSNVAKRSHLRQIVETPPPSQTWNVWRHLFWIIPCGMLKSYNRFSCALGSRWSLRTTIKAGREGYDNEFPSFLVAFDFCWIHYFKILKKRRFITLGFLRGEFLILRFRLSMFCIYTRALWACTPTRTPHAHTLVLDYLAFALNLTFRVLLWRAHEPDTWPFGTGLNVFFCRREGKTLI